MLAKIAPGRNARFAGKEPIFPYEKTLYVVKSGCKLPVPRVADLEEPLGAPVHIICKGSRYSLLLAQLSSFAMNRFSLTRRLCTL